MWTVSRLFLEQKIFIRYLLSLLLLLVLTVLADGWLKFRIYRIPRNILLHLLVSSVLTWQINGMLKSYMRDRIVSFLDPQLDQLASSWNLTQSIRAIGSGGLTGKGFLKGILAHYGYLPEQSRSTDFLFAVIGEEAGFLFCLLLFAVYLILIVRMIFISLNAQSPDEAGIVIAVSAMFLFHFLQNVGMTIHLMPITGIPLLLVSYGGSSLITAMALLGLVLNIHRRAKR